MSAPGVDGRFLLDKFDDDDVDEGPRSLEENSDAMGMTPSCEFVTPVVVTTCGDC